jgi:flagellar secretion chaperone FliS
MRQSLNPYIEYQSNQVNTADQKQLVIMLYDGAIKFLNESIGFLDNYKTYDQANAKIVRVQEIISELMISLDMEKGGEIAQNLFNLYAFMKQQLLDANIKKEPAPIKQVIKMLNELSQAWKNMKNDSKPDDNSIGQGFALRG